MMCLVAQRLTVFDIDTLQSELAKVSDCTWYEHPSQYHNHSWHSIALQAADGDASNTLKKTGLFLPTPIFAHTRAFGSIVEAFHCETKRIRLLRLAPESIIREHIDIDEDYYHNTAKIHIAVHTNPFVDFRVRGVKFHIGPGEAWYVNTQEPHEVKNAGKHDRIHLVMDCVVEGQLEAWMAANDALRLYAEK